MTYDLQIQEVVSEEQAVSPHIVLKSGVVLRFKKINIMRIMGIVNKFTYPEVPKIRDEKRGRLIDNPHDPEYQKAVAEIENRRGLAMIDAILVFGTEIEHIPEKVSPVESDDWVDEVEAGGLEVKKDNKTARYLAWVKYVAIQDEEDVQQFAEQFNVTVGTAEGNIAKSLAENFPDT